MIFSSNTRIPLGAGGIPLPYFGLTATTLDAIDQIPVEKVVATNQQFIESPPPPRPFDLGNYTKDKIINNDVVVPVDEKLLNSSGVVEQKMHTGTAFILFGALGLFLIFKKKK